MKRLTALFGALSLVALGAALSSPSAQAQDAASAEAGKATFGTYCATCHGDSGKGDGPASAALDPKPRDFSDAAYWADATDEKIAKVIKEGGAANGMSPLMTPWGGVLNDAQIAELVAYINTLKPAE